MKKRFLIFAVIGLFAVACSNDTDAVLDEPQTASTTGKSESGSDAKDSAPADTVGRPPVDPVPTNPVDPIWTPDPIPVVPADSSIYFK